MTEQKTPEQRLREIVKKHGRVQFTDGGGHERNIGITPELREALKEAAQVFADIAKAEKRFDAGVPNVWDDYNQGCDDVTGAILEAAEGL